MYHICNAGAVASKKKCVLSLKANWYANTLQKTIATHFKVVI